jgi:hypothetical protein
MNNGELRMSKEQLANNNKECKMSKEQRHHHFIISSLLFIFCFLLFCCKDFNPQDALPPGYGLVAITIKSASARTVFPMMAFAKYEYLFAEVTGGEAGEAEAQEPVDGYFTLKLGDWQVTINAYLTEEDTVPAVYGTSATFNVSSETIAHIVIQLGTDAEGFGRFSYSITYPDNAQISVFKLENLFSDDEIDISGSAEAGDGSLILTGTEENVPAGYYYLTIELTENEIESRTAGANEVVYIYDNLESEYSIRFTSKDFSHIHLWEDWVETEKPTETEDGLETKLCARDLNGIHTETRTLYATGTAGLFFELALYNNAYRVSIGSAVGEIHIPAMHRPGADSPYLPVTEIGSFQWSSDYTGVNIPASVTSISEYAFRNSNSLTGITVDGNNQHYSSEDGLLYNKAKTQLIAVPGGISGDISVHAGVMSIGSDAFSGCNNITGISLPASVTSIGNNAFINCTSLTGINIPAGLTRIGESAFSSCTSLTGITIPEGVTEIGSYAFSNCNSLTGITVDGNNPNYMSEDGILYNKAKTRLIAAPGAISGNISIPTDVTSIDNSAFSNCGSLNGITLPASVTTIDENAFFYCYNLETVTIAENSRLTVINNNAFNNCTKLDSITIPASVTTIGEQAFYYCNSLSTVDFAEGSQLVSINNNAFSNCGSLNSMEFPAGLMSIGGWAFSNCYNLVKITIPESVTSIGEAAFDWCGNLSQIILDGNNLNYTIEGGILYNMIKTQIIAIARAGITGTVIIPSSITSIGYGAFSNCTNLTGIEIPDSVTSIGGQAFYYCTGLESVTIPANLTSIGENAFYGCTSLTGISIPASVTEIGSGAFSACAGLTGITVNASNQYYSSEGGILYNKTKTQLIAAPGAISGTAAILSTVTTIGNNAFSNCRGLTGVTLPTGVTSIGNNAFSDCTGLTGITIPSGLMSIGDYAFSGCAVLSEITIPASVTSIGYYAFNNWGWSDSPQTINIMGYSSQAAAEAAWGFSWIYNCDATINYLGISVGDINEQFWREDTAVSLTAPQINPPGATVTAQGWQISDNGSGAWSNFTPPSTAAMSYNGKYLRYYATINGSRYYSNTVSIRVFASHEHIIRIEMWDSYGDGWDGAGALRIVVNTTEIASNVKASVSYASYTFSAISGDVVYFYWIEGGSQNENAFVVYYSDDPPSPAFNPANTAAVDDGRILLYRQYHSMGSISGGDLLGSFTVP